MVEKCRICLYNLTVLVHDPTDAPQFVRVPDPFPDQDAQVLKHLQEIIPVILRKVSDPAPNLWVQSENRLLLGQETSAVIKHLSNLLANVLFGALLIQALKTSTVIIESYLLLIVQGAKV